MEKRRNSQLEHGQSMELTRGLFCTCDAVNHNTSVTFLADECVARAIEIGSCQSNLCMWL